MAIKILTKNIEKDGYTGSIEDYIKEGGYTRIDKFLGKVKPQEVTEEVKRAGVRGRGGAGFPAGVKWGFIPKDNQKPVYLLCNADESEPGTFKDRVIMEKDPHMLLEGMILACYAIGSHTAYIYIRGEFVYPANVLNRAINEAYDKGYLGDNIAGSGFKCDITVCRGAAAYICGEETSLINSIEGKRGFPRLKPPFPAVEGVFGCPTIVNNVETLANVPWILEHGGDAYARIGVERSSGTKLFCVSGHVKKTGTFELEMGIPMKKLLYDVCGGIRNDNKLKGVIPGGSSMPVLTAEECEDVTMDYEALAKKGSALGSAAVIVMDDTVDMVNACLNLIKFYKHESCGQCTPCREGVPWMMKIIQRINNGNGKKGDIDLILDICEGIEGRTICPFGEAAVWPTRAFVTKFRHEFEEKITQANS